MIKEARSQAESRVYELLESVGAAMAALPREDLEGVLGEIERLRAIGWRRLLTPDPVSTPPQPLETQKGAVLSSSETAQRLGRSAWWVRQHKLELPLVRLPGGRYGFSEAGLERWINRRSLV